MMRLRAILFFLSILCLPSDIGAQQQPELFSNVDRVFREKEPAWKVEECLPADTSDPVKHRIIFSSRRGRASINISIWRREEDAREVFTATSLAIDNSAAFVSESLGRKVDDKKIKSSLPRLGDENHMWAYKDYPRRVIIQFRRGSVIVRVDAPTEVVAKRFAQRIFEQLAAGQQRHAPDGRHAACHQPPRGQAGDAGRWIAPGRIRRQLIDYGAPRWWG